MAKSEEILPLVDTDGNIVGSAPRSLCHDGSSMLLHPVVHLHVIDSHGRLLLQRRSMKKKIQPGRWDTAVGGHVSHGENFLEALQRESAEEIGLKFTASPILLKSYIFRSAVEAELVNCYFIRVDDGFKPCISEPDDIDELRFWDIRDITDAIDQNIFTPNFQQEFREIVGPYINSKF